MLHWGGPLLFGRMSHRLNDTGLLFALSSLLIIIIDITSRPQPRKSPKNLYTVLGLTSE